MTNRLRETIVETIPVDDITDVSWNEEMLTNLVLEPMMKTMVKGLIDQHSTTDPRRLQDLAPGKGSGLVMLFSGPPGIGKTATAVITDIRFTPPFGHC